MQDYIKSLEGLSEEQLQVVGLDHGWYNLAQKMVGLTARQVLGFLPRTMAAVAMATAGNDLAVAAGLEDAPVDLTGLEGSY